MRELHLFAGIGAGILGGMLLGHTPVCAVEIDKHCRKVLLARQRDGVLPSFPILEDVKEFDGKPWRGRVDVVCGGFPCQPFSSAGKRLGTADPRHLWPEMARIVSEVRPRYVFAENVSLEAFREPWRDLRGMGYRVPPAIQVSAADLGAPHLRKRWWLLAADADSDRMHELDAAQHQPGSGWAEAATGGDGCNGPVADADRDDGRSGRPRGTAASGEVRPPTRADAADADPMRQHARPVDAEVAGAPQPVANAHGSRLAIGQGQRGDACEQLTSAVRGDRWSVGARVRRVAHGTPSRVDRLRALGNAQVPCVASAAFRTLMDRLDP